MKTVPTMAMKNAPRNFLIFFLFSSPSLSFCETQISHGRAGSAAVVYQLYKDFAWEAMLDVSEDTQAIVGKPIARQNKFVLEKYFDRNLASLLVKDANCVKRARGEVCNLDFDPIFASQDPAAYDLRIVSPSEPGRVEVEFIYPANGKKIKIEYRVEKISKA